MKVTGEIGTGRRENKGRVKERIEKAEGRRVERSKGRPKKKKGKMKNESK